MNDVIKIRKSGVLIDGLTETVIKKTDFLELC